MPSTRDSWVDWALTRETNEAILTAGVLEERHRPILLGQIGRLEAVLVLEALVDLHRRLLNWLPGALGLGVGGKEKSEDEDES